MSRAADIVYAGDHSDALYANGDLALNGATLQTRLKAGDFDEATIITINIWNKINEQIPAKVTEHWARTANLNPKPRQN
jgi:hypothetical protein